MLDSLVPLLVDASAALYHAFWGLLAPAALFGSLAALMKGRLVFAGIWQVLSETRVNLLIACFNAVLMAPLFSLLFVWMNAWFQDNVLYQLGASIWDGMHVAGPRTMRRGARRQGRHGAGGDRAVDLSAAAVLVSAFRRADHPQGPSGVQAPGLSTICGPGTDIADPIVLPEPAPGL